MKIDLQFEKNQDVFTFKNNKIVHAKALEVEVSIFTSDKFKIKYRLRKNFKDSFVEQDELFYSKEDLVDYLKDKFLLSEEELFCKTKPKKDIKKTIELKYEIKQKVFFIKYNKICSGIINAAHFSSNESKTNFIDNPEILYNVKFKVKNSDKSEDIQEEYLFSNIEDLLENIEVENIH